MLNVVASVENARKIYKLSVKHNLTVDPALDEIFDSIPRATIIPGFAFKLKDYQSEGVAWLEKTNGTGILADEMGLGKTVQIMAYAHKNNMFPMLVVLPNTLKFNWRNEIIAMTGLTYRINIIGKSYSKKQTAIRAAKNPNVVYSKIPTPGCDIYVINYDILNTNCEKIEKLGIKFMVCDESHKCKNPNAKRTQAMQRLATGSYEIKEKKIRRTINVGRGVDAVTLMTGTPIINRPIELWTSVKTVASWVPNFSKFTNFAYGFCGATKGSHGWDFSGSNNEELLNSLLTKHCMLRRLKVDVLTELPPKTYRVIPLDFDRAEYDRVEQAFHGVDWKGGVEAMLRMGVNAPTSDERIVAIQKLREIAGAAKLASAVEWIQDFTEQGEKLVVFAHNRTVIETIKIELEKDEAYRGNIGVIYGGVTDEDRAAAVASFQNDPAMRVIIVGIQAGGFGLTLTAASSVAFIQLPWSPAEIAQCGDRIHRVGQTANQVTIYSLVAEGTIDETMAGMLINKGVVIDAVMDAGRSVNTFDLSIA